MMFWQVLLGQVIGGQTYRIPQMTREETKTLKTGRISPNAESSERAKNSREYVLKQFWQAFVEDKFDLEVGKRKVRQDPGSSQAHGYT